MDKTITKSYSFYCDDLNLHKGELLFNKAKQLRDYRNEISTEFSTNFKEYQEFGKFDLINKFHRKLEHCNNQDVSNAIEDVYVAYDNKRDQFKQSVRVKIQKDVKAVYYKRNTKNHVKGDLKSFKVNLKETEFTKAVQYLTRYYSPNIYNYMLKVIEENKIENADKIAFFKRVLNYIEKYGDRLIELIKTKQERIISSVFAIPIHFNSLSFSSCNEQKDRILNYNPNRKSKFNAFITLSGQKTETGKIHIPVKFSQKFHGSINDYDKEANGKNQKQISYTIVLERKNRIRIILRKEVQEEIIVDKTNTVGIDVNVKHNLFADSLGNFIDYDRKQFNDYVQFLKYLDNKHTFKKAHKLPTNLSNKDMKIKKRWLIRIKDMLKRKAHDLVHMLIKAGKDHFILEDLSSFGATFASSEEFEGFKYSRIVRLLTLADLKTIIRSIANKLGLQVSIVHPHYTSKGCKCGCISDLNRRTQEVFKCSRCGLEMPADTHSAEMIEDRFTVDVLRDKLLTFLDCYFQPKKLKKESIREILDECYDTDNNLAVIA